MIIYGTLKECTDKLFELIDFENGVFPDFDFASWVDEEAEDAEEAYESAESWHGVKNFADKFDCDTISLMCAHYSGGGIASLELSYESDEDENKEKLMGMIKDSVDDISYSVLEPDSYTVFEILEGNGEAE